MKVLSEQPWLSEQGRPIFVNSSTLCVSSLLDIFTVTVATERNHSSSTSKEEGGFPIWVKDSHKIPIGCLDFELLYLIDEVLEVKLVAHGYPRRETL